MIYDCFTYNGEADILEIRLNILDPYVDYFVLCESTQTFSGKAKPLYFEENKNRFKKWKDKIIHFQVEPKDFPNAFDRAAYQKDAIRVVLGALECKPEDIIYYGDVDEIWTPQKEEGKLRQLNYCYYLNNRSSEEWQGTNVVKYKNIRNLNELRADHSKILDNGGWHFTNMGGTEEVKRKLESYDHQEYNNDEVKSGLDKAIENGEDYVGRSADWQGKAFFFYKDEVDLPKYILDNKEKYKNLWK